MADSEDRPEAAREDLLRSVFEPSALDDVAKAVSVATEAERRIYVERIGRGWRWSFTQPGGAYPLLRATARFLRVDYRGITLAFRTVADGVCVLRPGPEEGVPVDVWAVVDFDEATSSRIVKKRILHAF